MVLLRQALSSGARRRTCHLAARAKQRGKEWRPSCLLRFGCKKPSVLVVFFHGLNDTAAGSTSMAQLWASGLPGSLVLVPQAPDKCLAEALGWGSDADAGYDWLRHGVLDTKDREACLRVLHRTVNTRVNQVNFWLDTLLQRYGLGQDQLILAGFSQGSIVASVCGARRKVRGIVACGGVPTHFTYSLTNKRYEGDNWKDLEKLLPVFGTGGSPPTKCCVVNGTADGIVLRKKVENMFVAFDTFWYWDEGAGHNFYRRWQHLILRWMRRLVTAT